MSEPLPPGVRSLRLRLLLLLVLLAGVALVLMATYRLRAAQPPAFHGTAYEDTSPAPDFALTAQDGRRVTLADFRGRPVLLFFGYTNCPDVCPVTLSRLTRIREELGGAAGDAQILLVTMDPARDTPAVLGEYVKRYAGGRGITGLTGDTAALSRAYAGYGAYLLPQPPADTVPRAAQGEHGAHAEHGSGLHGAMPHSSVVYGIDRAGRLRVVISESATEAETRDDVRVLAGL
jgi:protein SCO1/2